MQTQRQQQMFSVRKRSANAATAANVFCAKAQCKRSDSSKCFLCESAATATNVFCAKAQRQRQLHQGEN
ncbi:hypothetical protein [Lysinibacillus sphaericus]|uniref:hypothetical protein n=1 Tax=Lysinibacillus sphaericus TaxID=1421 RepID=UPI001CBC64D4|nr:hypothetical protein [Lysinibacillus sphaericus]